MTSPSAPDTQLSLAIDPARPYARLTLGSHVHSGYDLRSGRMQSISRHRAALAFIYAGEAVSGRPGSEPREAQRRIERRPAHEQEYRETLRRLGFKPATRRSDALEESAGEMFELPGDNAWLHFMQDDLPRLRQQGWFIDIRADFAYDLTPIDAWYAEVEEADDRQWFELELGIQVAGQRVSLLPALTELIRRSPALLDPRALARHAAEEQLVLRLELNPPLRVALPFGRLKPVLATLSDFYLGDPEPQRKLRLGAPDAARLADLDELPLAWEGGDNLRDFARRLRSFQARPATPPQGLRAELRPYQLEGLSWMQTLRELDSGGVLADDMGLGKTLQSLAHVLLEKQAGRLDTPALVVMPTSLIPNWLDEAERFAPDLRVLALHGAGRRRDFAHIDEHDLVLTTYALLPRDAAELGKRRFHLLILDEAQNIKNATTKAAVAARELAARHRLCLTGTPLENHLGELWSLFHFLMPGWLGDARQFAQDYRTPIEKHGDEAIVILEALLKLRQVCCDTRLLQRQEDGARSGRALSSGKLAYLLDMLDELIAEGRRVLLFSQFTSMLALIEDALRQRGVDYVLLTGETRDRRAPVQRFQSGKVPVFLISLKAGGVGLNLTAADTVIHYDPWWNPAVENQASDRAYRIGQDKPVFVYRLIARGTVEEKIQHLQQEKAALADGLFSEGNGDGWKLDEADIDALFAPLPKAL